LKIKNLTIKNFKAFYGEYTFDFCDDKGNAKNILIYGENGSGKSSLYWALYHMFYSFDKQQNIKKYKNIFNDDKEIFLKLEFDDEKKLEYKDGSIYMSDGIKNLFKKFKKVKLFLSYNDIFLLNELFDKNISIDKFISILKSLYGKDIVEKLDNYIQTKKDFKSKYFDKKCDIKKQLVEFREEYNEGKLLDNFNKFQLQYEDIKRWDKEGDFLGYGTIYYYSDDVINEYELFLNGLKILNNELEFNFDILENIIIELEDIKEYIYEKSKKSTEDRSSIDREEIETIDILEDLKSNLGFIEEIVDSYEDYKRVVNNLNQTISLKLEEQIKKINNILKDEFKLDLIIELRQKEFFLYEHKNLDKFFPIKYKININKISLKHNHLKFLNEAKISSINFAFYISIILSYAEVNDLKILILDDLLISLDMSNRDIILEMLLKYFSDYQLIILTHDKAFFEIAKQKFSFKANNQWKYFEMYVDKDCESNIELPFKKEYGQEYGDIDKAKEHFNNKDYPACANYLRKEVEKQFDKYLKLDNLDEKIKLSKLKENEHLIMEVLKDFKKLSNILKNFKNCKKIREDIRSEKCIEFAKQTESIIEKFKDYVDKKFYFEEFEDIKLVLKSILHPQSHSDITKPLYKKELKDAIELIEKFKDLLK